ncbi:MAG TPA: Ig-like domain-containing protein [Gemmatimonadaceae bacterium]|nr:Ig-like domain-containing protein [Gemmatimonadaceae bacterium]
MRRLIVAAAVLACASPGPPPGGPEDRAAPEVLSISPDSGSVGRVPRAVVFRFDEVVSERPQGSPELSQLFLISPWDGDPRVDWDRRAVAVRPARSWRANTVYTVTMLPGMSDLRGNARRAKTTVIFSTGAVIPNTWIRGILFDWTAGRPATRGAVEAVAQWDSTRFVAQTDSVGRFEFLHLPAGVYVVRGFADANGNRTLDGREAWDSLRVELTDSARVELLAFVRDSLGPRITAITARDSITLHVRFDRPLDPAQEVAVGLFSLKAQDSSVVPLRSARAAREFDRALADSARAAADTAQARDTTARRGQRPGAPPGPALPVPSRPIPVSDVIVQTAAPLDSGRSYRLEAREVRSLEGVPRTSDRVFRGPAAAPAPPPPARRDSAAATRP